jgi:hypothetical protein
MVSGILLKKSSMVSGCTYSEGLFGTKNTKGDWRGGYSILNTQGLFGTKDTQGDWTQGGLEGRLFNFE